MKFFHDLIYFVILFLQCKLNNAALPTQSSCGAPSISANINSNTLNRIISGSNSISNSWPWQVSLRRITISGGTTYASSHFCGGFLIYENYVMTAAHCVDTYSASELGVVVGISNIATENPSSSNTFYVSDRYFHTGYSSSTIVNDIAILKLSTSVTLGSTIALICLPSSSETDTILNKNVVVTGWGSTDGTRSSPATQLQETTLSVINGNSACSGYETTNNYCALNSQTSSNACFGDSGGPLIYYQNSKWYIFGVVSFVLSVNGDCQPTSPSFYTRVPNYITWTEEAFAFIASGQTQSSNSHSNRVIPSYNIISSTILATICFNILFRSL